jgi:hypothetical protein
MITCRFVGSDCATIGDREFDTVGQRATFSEQGFREAVLGHAAFITDKDFARVCFTQDELSNYGQSGLRINPSRGFLEKLSLAQEIFRDTYAGMEREANRVLAEASDVGVREPEPVVGL